MTNIELQEKLKNFPPNMRVIICAEARADCFAFPVEDVNLYEDDETENDDAVMIQAGERTAS